MTRSLQRTLALAALLTLAPGVALAQSQTPPRLQRAPVVESPADLPSDASVLLQVELSDEGRVTDASVVEGVRDDVDDRVLQAAREMRFTPATRDGQPVSVRVRFRFRLRAPEPVVAPPPTQPVVTPPTRPVATPTPAQPRPRALPRPRRRDPSEPGATVRGSRPEPGAATRMTFRAEELTTVPGTFGEPTRVVATLPGVARTPFGLGFFVVRGASFENTGFFIDGYPVLILYHLAAGPAVISSRLVDQLDFYPGGYPLEYGRFSAGVISLRTAVPPTQRPRVELEVDVFRAAGMVAAPFAGGRGSIAVAARRSYYDALLPLLSPGINVNFGDAQIRAEYQLSEHLRASLFGFISSDVFDRTELTGAGATAASSRDALRYDFGRVIAKLEYRNNNVLAQWSGMIGFDRTGLTVSDPGRPDRGADAHGAVLGTRASLRWQTAPGLTSTVGIDALAYNYTADVNYASPPALAAVPMPQANGTVVQFSTGVTQLGVAGYVEEVIRTGPLEFTAGSRVEVMAYQGRSFVVADPRAVLRARVNETLTLVGSSGIFHQPPPVFSLVPFGGSIDLLPQRAWQSSVSAELTLPASFEVRATGFYNRMWQLPRPSYDYVSDGQSVMRALALSDGEGRSYGLEMLIRRRIDRGVYGWLSYTLSRSERFVGDGRVVPFTFDQTHILNAAISWDIGRKLRIGARFQLSTGAPTSLVNCNPTCGVYDADADGYRPQYISEADRLPIYHQLDVRADYKFTLGPMQMAAFVDVLNVYYARNAEGWLYQYNYDDRRPRPGLPILPTVGIRGEL